MPRRISSGLRSKYGLNSKSAAQVIEDALSTDLQGTHHSAAAAGGYHEPYSSLAPSFPREQGHASPHKTKPATSQSIVPAGELC